MPIIDQIEPSWIEHGYGPRFQGFQNLMHQRIRDVLLVSSLYDLYLFEEDGRLYELIRNEYQGLHLSHSPEITRVGSASEALQHLEQNPHYDLIITTLHIDDITPIRFAKTLKEKNANIPVVLLVFDNRELNQLLIHQDVSVFDKIFLWQGDFRLIIGIIKYLEDKLNVEHDTKAIGVQSIILVEDSIRFYSSFLPIIYTELLKQSQQLITEGINLSHRYLRMRARPKILLCSTYEEAIDYFKRYEECILGVISDIDFKKNGMHELKAGLELAKTIKHEHFDIPIMLQSNNPDYAREANKLGASFILKDSPTLFEELRLFMNQHFSFGDFIFKTNSGEIVGVATDLRSLESQLKNVPEESIRFHAERNHFSNWLKARTEFWLAEKLRPKNVSDYSSIDELRNDLISSLRAYRHLRQRGIITDFNKETFDPKYSFARIGGGSLGGKARGLGFLNILINNYRVADQFENIKIKVPAAVVIGTDIFDQFLDENKLRQFALNSTDDEAIKQKFITSGKFNNETLRHLRDYLEIITQPIAVRSSSLLEDSQYFPFAGVYSTYMLPNNNGNIELRLTELINAIKLVYASTFFKGAKDYIKVTSYRLEEEKMAVIIQSMVGSQFDGRFYPHFAGVARSYNFYPVAPQKSEDGIASIALGLGKWVVEGGESLRVSPKYPNHIIQFATIDETLKNHQKNFFAIDMNSDHASIMNDTNGIIKKFSLADSEQDGSLFYAGSTYVHQNHAIYEGISREGMRLITFAPIFKSKLFPLGEILETLLEMGPWGMGTQVEIEFAVRISKEGKHEFGVLQMRPLVLSQEMEQLDINGLLEENIFCKSGNVLGNGVYDNIYDIVTVDIEKIDRSQTRLIASEVSYFNQKLLAEGKEYLLIGVGRWGTFDPWLGIPVAWAQISAAKVIVEASFKDFIVTPSQGSHFFQNLTSFMVGYFTLDEHDSLKKMDWHWIQAQKCEEEKQFVKHIRLQNPLTIKINARNKIGVILKPFR